MKSESALSLSELEQLEALCLRHENATEESDSNIELLLSDVTGVARRYFLRELLWQDIEKRQRMGDSIAPSDYAFTRPADVQVAKDVFAELERESGSADPQIAELPDRYQKLDDIGSGGIGFVWRVFDRRAQRTLAVKTLRAEFRNDRHANIRLEREAILTGGLQHPGVPPVHDHGRLADNSVFFAMRLIEGQTLEEILANCSGEDGDLQKNIGIFEKVAQTMAYVHSKDVIHRDLKPQNIMVGKFAEVQVMDWGMAKRLNAKNNQPGLSFSLANPPDYSVVAEINSAESENDTVARSHESSVNDRRLTQFGDVLGTPRYMAPEQARGELNLVGTRADVFSLGAILFEILTGNPLYADTNSKEVLAKVAGGQLHSSFSLLDKCDADAKLVSLCRRCLSPMAAARPKHAGIIANEVSEHFANVQQRVKAAEIELRETEVRAKEEVKRRKAFSRMLMLVVGVFALGVAGIIWQWSEALSAKNLAEENSEKHLAAEKLAKKRLLDSQLLANDFFTTVPTDERLDRPELREFRRELLNKSVAYQKDYLQKLEGSEGNWTAAVAWKSLAIVQNELAPAGKDFHNSIGKAIELFRTAFEEEADLADENMILQLHECLLRKANALGSESKFEEAAAFYEQSIELVEHGNSEKPQKALARSYGSFGWMYMNQGKVDDALRLINRSLDIVTPLAKKKHAQKSLMYKVMTDQLNLAAINLQSLQDYQEAIKHAKLGIEIGEKITTNSSQDPKTKAVLARCFMVKALAQGKDKQPAKSIDSFEDALKISTKLLNNGDAGPDSKYTHCMVCSFLAEAIMRSGDRERAEELNRMALDTFNALVKAHPQVTDYKNGVIEQSRALCSLLGICEESTKIFENSLQTYRSYLKQFPNDERHRVGFAIRLGASNDEANPELLVLTEFVGHLKSTNRLQHGARILAFLRNGDIESASAWERTLPKKRSIFCNLLSALVRIEKNEMEEARKVHDMAISAIKRRIDPPNDPASYFELLLEREVANKLQAEK